MATMEWRGKTQLVIDGVTYELVTPGDAFEPTAARFSVAKTPRMVRHHARLLESLKPKRIVELGIFRGGSTAMLAMLCLPEKLLAVDISTERVAGLDALVAERFGTTVEARYGIDQGDRRQLAGVVQDVMGSAPLDLVIDDASHHLIPSRTSFEVLYPMLRPGGLYVIEDWRLAPMQILSCELVCALANGLAEDVTFREHSVVIRRGSRPLDAFSLGGLIHADIAPGLEVAANVWTPERYQQLRRKAMQEASQQTS